MKLNILGVIVAGATFIQVGASPLRVIVVTNGQEMTTPQRLRFGHALADSQVAKMVKPAITNFESMPVIRRPCGQRIKDKAMEISNAFRHALGFSPNNDVPNHNGGMIHIMPFVGTPSKFVNEEGRFDHGGPNHPHPHHHFHHQSHKYHRWGSNFWLRIHNALMDLGPWEGRAVAFVLGCGIGVLLRMFWVLGALTYRSIRGNRDDEYTLFAVEEHYIDAENIVVPPPSYTIADEKEQVKVRDIDNTAN